MSNLEEYGLMLCLGPSASKAVIQRSDLYTRDSHTGNLQEEPEPALHLEKSALRFNILNIEPLHLVLAKRTILSKL